MNCKDPTAERRTQQRLAVEADRLKLTPWSQKTLRPPGTHSEQPLPKPRPRPGAEAPTLNPEIDAHTAMQARTQQTQQIGPTST